MTCGVAGPASKPDRQFSQTGQLPPFLRTPFSDDEYAPVRITLWADNLVLRRSILTHDLTEERYSACFLDVP